MFCSAAETLAAPSQPLRERSRYCPDSPDALFGIAQAHQENGESQAAADYFRRYLIVSPGDQTAWVKLGFCLLALGQRDGGHDCFRTVARRDAKGFGSALSSLVKSSRGRFWLKPSAASQFLRGKVPHS